jgi:hypothetical protein
MDLLDPPAGPLRQLGQRGSDKPHMLHFRSQQFLQNVTMLALGASRLPAPMTINRVMGLRAPDKVPVRAMSVQANTSAVGQMYMGSAMR